MCYDQNKTLAIVTPLIKEEYGNKIHSISLIMILIQPSLK